MNWTVLCIRFSNTYFLTPPTCNYKTIFFIIHGVKFKIELVHFRKVSRKKGPRHSIFTSCNIFIIFPPHALSILENCLISVIFIVVVVLLLWWHQWWRLEWWWGSDHITTIIQIWWWTYWWHARWGHRHYTWRNRWRWNTWRKLRWRW